MTDAHPTDAQPNNSAIQDSFAFHPVRPEEADEAVEMEQICFPPHEACSEKHMKERMKAAPELFLVATDRETGRMAGFLTGIATNETVFRDDFFTDAGLHMKDGNTVMLVGLNVHPDFRNRGLARELVSRYCDQERERGRQRLVLTCLEEKVAMYRKMGFRDLGMSASVWGGEQWHEMEYVLFCSAHD